MSDGSFVHCPLCGSSMASWDDGGRSRPRCVSCGFVHYRNPAPAAGVLIMDGDRRVLLVKRKFDPYKGTWVIPSGYIENNEDVRETAAREIREETGADVELAGIRAVESCFDDPRGNTILVIFDGKITGGGLRPGDDAEDARFFPLDDLPEIGFNCHKRILARLSAGGAG